MIANGELPAGLDCARVAVESPRDPSHGDAATNAAMVLAKPAGMKPRDLGETLAARLRTLDNVTGAEVAGPGFVNLRLRDTFWHGRLQDMLRAGLSYGDSDLGAGEPVNVEYVSANPTGPLHVGHGRGAVVGDALAGLLQKAGHAVTREYYVNDAGAQVEELAWAAYGRYLEHYGADLAEGSFAQMHPAPLQYQGDYLIEVGKGLAAQYGKRLGLDGAVLGIQAAHPSLWMEKVRSFVVAAMMDLIRDDLEALGIRPAVFTSERELVAAGAVEEAVKTLEDAGLVYTGVLEPPKGKLPDDWEERPQTLFRSTQFGDDIDRPLRKSDGSWTYFATDIAYHLDKIRRGFGRMIDVWGADHGGYVKRMEAAVAALGGGAARLDVRLCQLVKLLEAGQPVKMSKRAGTYVTLREMIDRVGRDVVRFIMLTRKNDAQLDFDLAKAMEQSRDNPVFYVQYAHARCCSVLRHAAEGTGEAALQPDALAEADLSPLTDPAELALIRQLAGWPQLVEQAAQAREPHRVAFYLYDVAAAFHGLWTKGKDDASLRFLVDGDAGTSRARLALVKGTALVVASGLSVMGVQPVEEMH
ncbi:MAG: arginine--tRNA ligase [Acetobacterales bacterium]